MRKKNNEWCADLDAHASKSHAHLRYKRICKKRMATICFRISLDAFALTNLLIMFSTLFNLNKCGGKSVVVCIEARDKFVPAVFLCRNNALTLKLSKQDIENIVSNEASILNYFTNWRQETQSTIRLSDELHVRFDNSYASKMVVVERTDPLEPTQRKKASVWFIDSTWIKFVSLLPLISHCLTIREKWLPEIEAMFSSIVQDLVFKKNVNMEQGFDREIYKTAVQNLVIDDFVNTSVLGLDMVQCYYELLKNCPKEKLFIEMRKMHCEMSNEKM